MPKTQKGGNAKTPHAENDPKTDPEKASHKSKITLFSKNIDYLTLRISETSAFARQISGLVENNAEKFLDHGFRLVFRGYAKSNRIKLYDIQSETEKMIAQIHLKMPSTKPPLVIKTISPLSGEEVEYSIPQAEPDKIFSEIEFVGLFCMAYQDFLPYFLGLLEFNPDVPRLVSRIDYRFDIQGIDCHDFLKKYVRYRNRVKNFVTEGRETWRCSVTETTQFAIYNKTLDIIDNNKLEIVALGERPYLPYMQSTKPITRLEYRKKAKGIKDLVDSSLNALLKSVETDAADYINANTGDKFDIWKLTESKRYVHDVELTADHYDRNTDEVSRAVMKRILNRSILMATSYLKTYRKHTSEDAMFEELYRVYGMKLLLKGFEVFSDKEIPAELTDVYQLKKLYADP